MVLAHEIRELLKLGTILALALKLYIYSTTLLYSTATFNLDSKKEIEKQNRESKDGFDDEAEFEKKEAILIYQYIYGITLSGYCTISPNVYGAEMLSLNHVPGFLI